MFTHGAPRPGLCQRRFKLAMDLAILVLVLDLAATFFHANPWPLTVIEINGILEATPATLSQREITNRNGAGVEMLVEPPTWGNYYRARLPIDPHPLLPFLPQQRVPLTAQNRDVGAGAVLMGLLVASDRELRDMSRHRLTR